MMVNISINTASVKPRSLDFLQIEDYTEMSTQNKYNKRKYNCIAVS